VRRIVLLAAVALDKAFGFPVFEGEGEVIADGLRGCQRLEAADGLFRRSGSESGNSMERVISSGGNRNVRGGHQWWDGTDHHRHDNLYCMPRGQVWARDFGNCRWPTPSVGWKKEETTSPSLYWFSFISPSYKLHSFIFGCPMPKPHVTCTVTKHSTPPPSCFNSYMSSPQFTLIQLLLTYRIVRTTAIA